MASGRAEAQRRAVPGSQAGRRCRLGIVGLACDVTPAAPIKCDVCSPRRVRHGREDRMIFRLRAAAAGTL